MGRSTCLSPFKHTTSNILYTLPVTRPVVSGASNPKPFAGSCSSRNSLPSTYRAPTEHYLLPCPVYTQLLLGGVWCFRWTPRKPSSPAKGEWGGGPEGWHEFEFEPATCRNAILQFKSVGSSCMCVGAGKGNKAAHCLFVTGLLLLLIKRHWHE